MMFEANRIAVVVDPEVDNASVIDKAIMIARVSRAKIDLMYSEYVHCLEDSYFYNPVVAKTLREEHNAVNADRQVNSRLSCQIQLSEELDGLVVTAPEFQFAKRGQPPF